MTGPRITKGQFILARKANGKYVFPTFLKAPSLGPVNVGHPLVINDLSYQGIPTPAVTYRLKVDGVTKAYPYTFVGGDSDKDVSLYIDITSLGNTTTWGPLTAHVPIPGQAPGPVTGPLTFTNLSTNGMTVSWAAPTTGGTPTSYLVAYKPTGSATYSAAVEVTDTFLVLSNLRVGTSYDVQVIAASIDGNSSAVTASQATQPNPVKWGDLGYIGGNINVSVQYIQAQLFRNAVFNTGGFMNASQGPTPLDSNRWPSAGGWMLVISASVNATNTSQQPHLRSGQLTLPTYTNCEYWMDSATGSLTALTAGAASITGVQLKSDDGTTKKYTFTYSPTLDNNNTIYGNAAIKFLWVPTDGSEVYNPAASDFSDVALNYYAQLQCGRLMDMCEVLSTSGHKSGVGRYGERTWSGRTPNTTMKCHPYSWETVFSFINAVRARNGGKTKFWINLPGFADTDYPVQLATLANAMGVAGMMIEVGNECWNPAYYYLNMYQYGGYNECQVLADYGQGTWIEGLSSTNPDGKVISITSDASRNVTVTMNCDPRSMVPELAVGVKFSAFPSAGGAAHNEWGPGGAAITHVDSTSFTYPTTAAPISSSLANFSSMYMTFSQQNVIQSVVSDAAGNVTVTLIPSVPLSTYPFIYQGQKMLANAQLSSAWSVGTLAAPVTIDTVNTVNNSFTYKCATAPASTSMANSLKFSLWFGQTANSGVGLDSDLIKGTNSFNVYTLGYVNYTRQIKRMRDAWFTVRTQDGFMLALQGYGSTNPGNQYSPPVHFSFGKYLGNLPSSSTPNLSWLTYAATAPYFTGTGSTVDAAFAAMNATLADLGYKIDAHVFWCLWNNLIPICYEWGPDTSAMTNLQIEVAGDPRMGALIRQVGLRMLQAGFHETNYFNFTPGALQEFVGNSAWSAQQSFDDVWTNNKTLALMSLKDDHVSYANANGTLPCVFPVINAKMHDNATFNRPGVITALRDLTSGAVNAGYVDGTYNNVALTGGPFNSSGFGLVTGAVQARATIIVSGGVVTSCVLNSGQGGTGYHPGDVLSCISTALGAPVAAVGTQFTITVDTTNANAAIGDCIAAFGSTGTRDMYWLASSNDAGHYTFQALGTDSVAGTLLYVYINGVLQGSVTLPQGGSASSPTTCVPALSNTLDVVVPVGPFILEVAFGTGTGHGTAPGLTQVSLS